MPTHPGEDPPIGGASSIYDENAVGVEGGLGEVPDGIPELFG